MTSARAGISSQQRRGFALIAFAFFINMLGTTLPTPLYPLYQQHYGFTPATITIVFASYALAVVAGLLLFGHQSDALGRRAVLLPGLALSALSAIAFFFAGNLTVLLLGRVLSGVSAGIFSGTGTAALVDFAPPDKRRDAALKAVVANIGGLSAGTLLGGLLGQYVALPLRVPYAVDLVLTLVAIAAVALAPETVRVSARRFRLTLQRLQLPQEMRATFLRAAVAGMAAFAVSGAFSSVAPVMLSRELGMPEPALSGALVFLLFAASCAGQIAVERLPRAIAFATGSALLLAGLAALAAAIAWSAPAALFVSALLAGIGQGIVVGFGLANVHQRVAPEHRGAVTSTYFVVLYVALAVPVIGVGLLSETVGLRSAGLVFCVVVAAALVAALAWRPAGEQEREPAAAD
jgi:MFS family permease